MAKKWSEVANSPEFMALAPEQKEAARSQYFDQVVAPQVPSAQLQAVRQQFDADTRITDLPAVAAERPDFSGVTATVDSTAAQPGDVGEVLGRFGGRQVLQGVGGLIGAVGGDAFNQFIVDPIRRQIDPNAAPTLPYREAAGQLADELGMQRPQNAAQRVVSDIGEALTGTALTGGLGGAVGIESAAGRILAANPGGQALATAAGAGASGATRESGGGTGAQLAAGLAGAVAPGVAVRGVPGAVSGVLSRSVPEARRELAREAAARGIELTPAQLSDSRFLKFAQSALRSVPFTGAAKRYENQVGQFNRALAGAIGENAEAITPQVYSAAKSRQSALFNELTSRNALKVDDKLVNSLKNVADSAKIDKDISAAVEAAIERLYSQISVGPDGVVIPGRAYQAFDSTLNNVIKSGKPSSYFLGNVQEAVRNAMDRSISPQDAAAWRALRREYGNRKTLTPLVAKAGEEGMIRPAAVQGAATNNAASKEAMASGRRGELGTLAKIGQVMKEPPSSGTAERLSVLGGLVGGGALIDPATSLLTVGAARLLSQGLDSRSLARLMIKENPGLSLEDAQAIIARSTAPAVNTLPREGN